MENIKCLLGSSPLEQSAAMRNMYQQQQTQLVDSLADTNYAMKRLAERMEKQERRIDMLSGFYTWILEVYPEIAAQHKAMRDLYEAANSNETQGRQA